MHACGCAHDRGQACDVLVVSVLALILINLALRSEVQGRIEILGVGERATVVGLGTTPIAIVGEAEIEDEVPGPGRVLKVADDLDVASLLPARFASRDAKLRAHLVAGRAEERVKDTDHPIVGFGGT